MFTASKLEGTVSDGDVHLASTDNVFTTSWQGSPPNTSLEILMEQLLLPRQAFKT